MSEQAPSRPIYEPSNLVWWIVGLSFPAGTWLNFEIGLHPFSPVGLFPFAVLITFFYPVVGDARPTPEERLMGVLRRPTPWWSARTRSQWTAAARRAGVAALLMLAAFGLEALLVQAGVGVSREY